jgi:hypothetical protein
MTHTLDSGIAQLEMALLVARGRAANAHPTDRSAAGEVQHLEQAIKNLKAKKESGNGNR